MLRWEQWPGRWRHLLCSIGLLCAAHSAYPAATSLDVSEEKIVAVEQLLTEKMSAEGIPGLSIAIVLDGALAWSRGYGMADVENSVPATATTAYRTASIGKALTATAVMQLAEASKIELDAPIQRYCPSFPSKRWTVTTRHLLTHTSGIRHYGGAREEQELFNTRHYGSVVEALHLFQEDPLQFEPGTQYQYSTFGYNVLGCIVEGVTGGSFLDAMRRQIFDPAGMLDTRDDDPAAVIPRRAAGYVRTASGTLQNSRSVDMSSKLPAGGYISTVEDLARFAAALMNHELVRPETLEAMRTPTRLPQEKITGYGMGLGVMAADDLWYGEREAFHGGGTPQVSGVLYMLPERRFAVILLMNLEARPERVALAAQIAKQWLNLGGEQP